MLVSFFSKIPKLIMGIIGGFISCIVFTFLFSFIFTFTSINEAYIPIFSVSVLAVSAFINGFVSVRLLDNAGLINGLISGILFCVLFTFVSFLFGNNVFEISKFVYSIIIVALSILGGITAINLK